MSVYLMAGVNKHDAALYDQYVEKAMPSIADHDVEVLVISDAPRSVEGENPYGRYVLLKFRDQSHFDKWYNSPAYQQALSIRHSASETPFIVTVDGFSQ
jgi:uncharacterized protein (DUF1330 family)